MIKIKNNFCGKHTDRYIFPKLGRNLVNILIEIFNLETMRGLLLDAGALNLYLIVKKEKVKFFLKNNRNFNFNYRIFI